MTDEKRAEIYVAAMALATLANSGAPEAEVLGAVAMIDGWASKAIGKMYPVLNDIAFGRLDCGHPRGGEAARQMARECLDALGLGWSRREP